MRYRIRLEDLAANAFITRLNKGADRTLTYGRIESYGSAVCAVLASLGDSGTMILGRDDTRRFLRDYERYYIRSEKHGRPAISLRDEITAADLISEFRGYLPLDLLRAFVDPRATEILMQESG